MRIYRAAHREELNAYLRTWRQAHPERVRLHHERNRHQPRRRRPGNPTDLGAIGWTAGILDGEGSIIISRFHPRHNRDSFNYSLRVQVATTDLPMIRRLYELWGGTRPRRMRRLESGRSLFGWAVSSLRAEEVLRVVRAHLITKAAQADLAFEFRATALRKPSLGAPYYIRMKALRKPVELEG